MELLHYRTTRPLHCHTNWLTRIHSETDMQLILFIIFSSSSILSVWRLRTSGGGGYLTGTTARCRTGGSPAPPCPARRSSAAAAPARPRQWSLTWRRWKDGWAWAHCVTSVGYLLIIFSFIILGGEEISLFNFVPHCWRLTVKKLGTAVQRVARSYAATNLVLVKVFLRDPFYIKVVRDKRISLVSFMGNAGNIFVRKSFYLVLSFLIRRPSYSRYDYIHIWSNLQAG